MAVTDGRRRRGGGASCAGARAGRRSDAELERIRVAFGERAVLAGASLALAAGEIVALLGPSGSGKSTLLRVVAGLERPAAGRVRIDGVDVTGLAPHRRGVGLVFQDDLLFPHLDVAGNVAFGLRMAGLLRAARAARVDELLALVGLEGFGRRRVGALSGGEAQRVALARALAPAPRVLLLDEPFAALDRALHDRLVDDVRALLVGLGTTALHVTHDVAEAERLATRVVRLDAGRVVDEIA